eukprot:Polyplicarium_translucidae@DN2390_c1_g1_i3.p1
MIQAACLVGRQTMEETAALVRAAGWGVLAAHVIRWGPAFSFPAAGVAAAVSIVSRPPLRGAASRALWGTAGAGASLLAFVLFGMGLRSALRPQVVAASLLLSSAAVAALGPLREMAQCADACSRREAAAALGPVVAFWGASAFLILDWNTKLTVFPVPNVISLALASSFTEAFHFGRVFLSQRQKQT